MNRISIIIEEVCRGEGINYQSKYLDKQFYNDAKKIGEIYLTLRIIAGELQSISERHKIKELDKLLHNEAVKIMGIDHDLIHLAKRIKEEDEK